MVKPLEEPCKPALTRCRYRYLISQFLSLLSNKREDEFGGSLENRARSLYPSRPQEVQAPGAGIVNQKGVPARARLYFPSDLRFCLLITHYLLIFSFLDCRPHLPIIPPTKTIQHLYGVCYGCYRFAEGHPSVPESGAG
ncbi:hypothetical protein ACFL4W_03485 [Planctomycetota bacterium]